MLSHSQPAARAAPAEDREVSVVLPCLNEARTVGTCVRKAVETLERLGLRGEVVVVDNASTDDSAAVAARAGARVVHEPVQGYGSAFRRGVEESTAPFVIVADADDSYDLTDLERFHAALGAGNDLVMGSRRLGTIRPGAMPWLHHRIGNPLLSWVLRLFFGRGVSDAHCGMRAFTRQAYRRMQLRSTGMELASEMVVKAVLGGLKIAEIPITLERDGRGRRSHLRPWRDGWRHLRFMLLFSPTSLFLIPGALFMAVGLLPLVLLGSGPRHLGRLGFDVHYMVLGSLLAVLGYQIIVMGIFAKLYSHAARLHAPDRVLDVLMRYFGLERGLLAGGTMFGAGFVIDGAILVEWLESGMGNLDAVRPALQASTLMILGVQTIFASFLLSIGALSNEDDREHD